MSSQTELNLLELDLDRELQELATRSIAEAFAEGWTPSPPLTVSEWADQNRVLDSKASAEPGAWRTSRTPYLREIMDSLGPEHPAHRVVFMKGAQIGATEAGHNWIGYVITTTPGPMLLVRPSGNDAKLASKQRLAPMIAGSPCLSSKVADSRTRDSGNTILAKEFPGGILILTGANTGTGLRGMPIRFLFCDEVDEYPGDVDGQGDPLSLAEKRTSTFTRRKVYLVSTPTVKGISKIEKEFLVSDQRRYFVPCPDCGHMDWIRWENIRFENRDPSTARLLCVKCGVLIDERFKGSMILRGEWRATAEGTPGVIGFHLSALYSPLGWKSWAEIVQEFLEAKDDRFKLKTWWNTILGETWEERGETADAGEIMGRLERYEAEVPAGVGALVASVDVQGDRLEAQVKGFGAGEESWLVAFSQFHGDPATNETVWNELDAFLRRKFTHESGQKVPISCSVLDSNYLSEQVYKFAKARQGRNVFAVRGGSERGKPVVGRPTSNNRYRAKVFTLCVDTAKDIIYARLRIRAKGPGFIHFPEWMEEEYAEQLTAETALWKYVKGRGAIREWVKTRERNEALDLEVYCLAALYILGVGFVRSLPERAEKLKLPPTEIEQTQELDSEAARRFRRGWVDGWKE